MAEGYARVTGKPGVLIVTSGPGATNTVTPLQDALMDGTPLVVLAGQVPSAMVGTDAFQEADIVGMRRKEEGGRYEKIAVAFPRISELTWLVPQHKSGRPPRHHSQLYQVERDRAQRPRPPALPAPGV
jgi:hypothetical protein